MVKGPEQMRCESEHCENMWNACTGRCKTDINHGTAEKKGSHVQAANKDHREPTMPLAEAEITVPLTEAGQHCLSQRPEGREIVVCTTQDTGCCRIDSHLLDT